MLGRVRERYAEAQEPCDGFEANERAFGCCKRCGFTLADHFRQDGGYSEDEEEEESVYEDVPPPPSGPCKSFTVQKGSSNCSCGFAMEDHEADDRGNSMRLSLVNNLVKRISKRFSNVRGQVILANPGGHACEEFRLDLTADQYGLCSCGFNKLEHEKMSQLRHEITAKEMAQNAKRKKEERGDPNQPCGSFELDLSNKDGYGVCTCGFRRDQHMDFTLHGEFQNMRSTLTTPKAFH